MLHFLRKGLVADALGRNVSDVVQGVGAAPVSGTRALARVVAAVRGAEDGVADAALPDRVVHVVAAVEVLHLKLARRHLVAPARAAVQSSL